jgi:hypothetical protein
MRKFKAAPKAGAAFLDPQLSDFISKAYILKTLPAKYDHLKSSFPLVGNPS